MRGKTAAAAVPHRLIPSNYNDAACISIEETGESAGAAVAACISIKKTGESAGAAGVAVAVAGCTAVQSGF